MIPENEIWLLSYYRSSEIVGAMFFGRVARSLRPSAVQADMMQHFADEAQHARWFTECMESLNVQPLKLPFAYQDDYLATAGPPANFMEILSITQVFEKRILNTYAHHLNADSTLSPVRRTLQRIMRDERWHVQWVRDALRSLESVYGKDEIEATHARHLAADRETFGRFLDEHAQRVEFLRDQKANAMAL
jgi:rubrerythrin